jgi:hypothetical protein
LEHTLYARIPLPVMAGLAEASRPHFTTSGVRDGLAGNIKATTPEVTAAAFEMPDI